MAVKIIPIRGIMNMGVNPMPSFDREWLAEEVRRLSARMPKAPPGSKEAALACFDLWEGTPEEKEEVQRLLQEVESSREQSMLPIEDKHS
jgi:hypothetical protein